MSELVQKYISVLQQGFMPICVADRFDIAVLAQATVDAGASAIEITCRRPDAMKEILRVRREFPQLLVFVGSVVDDGPLLQHLQRRSPQMPSIAQLLAAGVDGIVSALPLRLKTIEQLSRTHLVVPGVESISEAVQAVESGAHLAKLWTADLVGGRNRVRRLTSAPTHGLLPLFLTGGVTLDRISEYLDAGVAMLGSGWDVLLGDEYHALQEKPDLGKMSAALKRFLTTFQSCRSSLKPEWKTPGSVSDQGFLRTLNHYVPQQWLTPLESK